MAAPQGTSSSRRGGQTQLQASDSSRPTITTTDAPPQQPVLRLRGVVSEPGVDIEDGGEGSTRRRIQWAEDVVDNEGLGRKKSKVCCIYHAPKGIDESSDESSSDSDDSSSGDDGSARPAAKGKKACGKPGHSHDHGKGYERKRSPNAYEKIPKSKNSGPKESG